MPDLEDLYREIILDHYRNPRNRGELQCPPAVRAEGFNPLCGDEVIIYVEMDNNIIKDIKFAGHGCSISQASSSMMSAAVKGRSKDEIAQLDQAFKTLMSIEAAPEKNSATNIKLGDIEALRGVVKFPVRIKCATLSWHTLTQALQDLPCVSEGE